MADIGYIAGSGVDEEVFCECWGGVRMGLVEGDEGVVLVAIPPVARID